MPPPAGTKNSWSRPNADSPVQANKMDLPSRDQLQNKRLFDLPRWQENDNNQPACPAPLPTRLPHSDTRKDQIASSTVLSYTFSAVSRG